MAEFPTFVVVGHVNKGKSSVVATLLEDATIPIDLIPGTTSEAKAYDLRLQGRTVLRLVDTPGFQEATAALEWMGARADQADQRLTAVRDFVDEFQHGTRFEDECQLLTPLLESDSAAVLYVVDASLPYRATQEAEMEILRWTGRPGIALMNRIGDRDHVLSWRPVLQQFFSIVREFDTHEADFEKRLRLFRTFAELDPEGAPGFLADLKALDALHQDRDRRAALRVAEYLIETWCHVERRSLAAEEDSASLDDTLSKAYRRHLRRLEARCRKDVEQMFGFLRLDREGEDLDLDPGDLFDRRSWKLFGLTTRQLALRAAVAGGATGGLLDLAVGGLSFGTGAAMGGAIGAAGAWFGSRQVSRHWTPKQDRIANLLPGEHGHQRCFGPIRNPAFAWILLDRALGHLQAVRHRAHARQDALQLPATTRARDLPKERLEAIDGILRDCQKENPTVEPLVRRLHEELDSL